MRNTKFVRPAPIVRTGAWIIDGNGQWFYTARPERYATIEHGTMYRRPPHIA